MSSRLCKVSASTLPSPYIRSLLQRQAIHKQVFPHDDSVNDRTPGSRLDNASKDTIEAWNRAYDPEVFSDGVPYQMPGKC